MTVKSPKKAAKQHKNADFYSILENVSYFIFHSKNPETVDISTISGLQFGGATQIWTGGSEFCRLVPYHLAMAPYLIKKNGADDEARTRYLHLGKVALYQMSYIRK